MMPPPVLTLVRVPLSNSSLPFATILDQTSEFFAKWTANPPGPPPAANPPAAAAAAATSTNDPANGGGQKTMSHFFSAHAAASSLPPPPPPAAPATGVPSIFASSQASKTTKEAPLEIDGEENDSDAEVIIPLPPRPTSTGPRAKIEIAYQQDEERQTRTPHTGTRERDAHATKASSTVHHGTTAASSNPSLSLPPSHLALSCRHCSNPLASLPIVQPVANAPPYQQSINTSYFTATVASAVHKMNGSVGAAPESMPQQVGALVCSAFALQPPDVGAFGWIGYPCAVPEGMPSQTFLCERQFHNVFSEDDQICYQPLCCAVST